MASGIAVAVLATLAWVLAHIALMHARPAQNRILAMTLTYAASIPLVYALYRFCPMPGWIEAALAGEPWGLGLFHAYLLHLLLFFLFVECFYHVERAVTLRILLEIHSHAGGEPALDKVRENYDLRDMVERRLCVLREHGYIERRDERWRLKAKGRVFARAMRFSAWVFQSKGQRERA